MCNNSDTPIPNLIKITRYWYISPDDDTLYIYLQHEGLGLIYSDGGKFKPALIIPPEAELSRTFLFDLKDIPSYIKSMFLSPVYKMKYKSYENY